MKMTSFFCSLKNRIAQTNSLLCIGLDPHVDQLPQPKNANSAEQFCLNLIQQTTEVAAAYKPNAAFFEAFGPEGIQALANVIKAIPEGIPVLLDAKRGDISTTAAAYATAAFDTLNAHAITLAPYMGRDSIDPFVAENPSRGCFVLCKTSNPSSNDFQTLHCSANSTNSTGSTQLLYERVALLAKEWNTNDNVGLVVGATDVEALKRVRAVVPDLWILAPGIGAQGGNLEEAVSAGLSADGLGMLIPVSRGISKADNPRQAAIELRDSINKVREAKINNKTSPKSDYERMQADFIKFALSSQVLKFGQFTLKSGRISPYFFNAGLFSGGRALAKLGQFYAKAIHESNIEFDVLFGPAYKGITLVAAIAIAYAEMYDVDIPFAYNRKEKKDHGEGGNLVGATMTGKRVLIVDDVITAGTAIGEAIGILSTANAITVGVCISLDRQERPSLDDNQSAIQKVEAKFGIPVVSIANLCSLIAFLKESAILEENDETKTHLTHITNYRQEYGI